MIQTVTRSATYWLRDSIFPVFCFGCQIEGEWLCQSCRRLAPPVALQRCLGCRAIHPFGQLCRQAQKSFGLDYLVSRSLFHEWLWQDMLHAWKYKSATELHELFITFMLDCTGFLPTNIDIIVPVPLSRRRLSDRGFNQAEILGRALATNLGLKLVTGLRRVKDGPAQASLPHEERLINIDGVFAPAPKKVFENKKCLIVDDVVTTGATLRELSMIMRQAGAQSVSAVTLLRSETL